MKSGIARTLLMVFLALGVFAPLAAAGAGKNPPPRQGASQATKVNAPMRFVLVRVCAGPCAPNCPEWIAAEGKFVKGSARALQRVLTTLGDRHPPVFFHSSGGSVDEALEVGRLIRARRLNAAVAWSDQAGNVGPGACYSACPLALAGGVRRASPPMSRIGVHRVMALRTVTMVTRRYLVSRRATPAGEVVQRRLLDERRKSRTSSREGADAALTRRLRAYLDLMGVSADMLAVMETTPHSGIRLLSPGEQIAYRIATELGGAERLLSGPTQPQTGGQCHAQPAR